MKSSYLDEHTGLVVRVCGEGLSLLGGDGGVTLDQDSHDTSSGLNTQRQRSNVEKEQILDILRLIPREDGRLHS
jgi:hypothetical protein